METIIKQLKALVETTDAATVDKTIADAFPKLSVKSAANVRKDVQDFIDGKMSESELSYYLNDYGLELQEA